MLHLSSIIYGVHKNGVVQNTTMCSNVKKTMETYFLHFYGQHNHPSENIIKQTAEKFQRSGAVEDQRAEKCSCSLFSQEHIDSCQCC